MPKKLRRVGWLAALAAATLLEISCGEVYRPVVIPVNSVPPNPANFHAVFGVAANVPFNPGSALQIDVSGDTNIGAANMGVNPTHAAILPNNSRVFVASAGSLYSGDADVVTAFAPAFDSSTATGLGPPVIFTYPNIGATQSSAISAISEAGNVVTITLSTALTNAVLGAVIAVSGVDVAGYNGTFQITSVSGTTVQYVDAVTGLGAGTGGAAALSTYCSYLPDYVTTTQSSSAFVANYGAENGSNCDRASTDSVSSLNIVTSVMSNIAYLDAGSHPVAMAVTANAQHLYVLNQGTNTVTDLSPLDLSTLATIPVGLTPAWTAARPDSQRVYVVTQGDGQLYTIRTDSNTTLTPQSVGGAGANFVLHDPSKNRLYVTNPTAGTVFVFDASTDPPTPLGNPAGIAIAAPPVPSTTPCTGGTCSYTTVSPVAVTALPDGSRFYVTSYVTAGPGSPCPDPNVTSAGCVIPQVTVFDAGSLTVKTTVFPLLAAISAPVGNVQPFAVAPVAFCAPAIPYTPAAARFRMFAASATDSSRVYASMCDAGSIAIITTTTSSLATGGNTPDTLMTALPAPFSAGPAQSNNQPLPQNPVFLLRGQ